MKTILQDIADIADIAEGFNEYFSNIGPNLASNIDSSNYNFETHVKNAKSEFAAFQHVTVSHVSHLLHGLSSNKATGIDKISCKIIKQDACRGVHSACRREVLNRHKLDICILYGSGRDGSQAFSYVGQNFLGSKWGGGLD